MMHNLFKLNTLCNQRPIKIPKTKTSVAKLKLKQDLSTRAYSSWPKYHISILLSKFRSMIFPFNNNTNSELHLQDYSNTALQKRQKHNNCSNLVINVQFQHWYISSHLYNIPIRSNQFVSRFKAWRDQHNQSKVNILIIRIDQLWYRIFIR